MSNSFEMMARVETETRARRPDLGRQVNSGTATAPRRRLVRRPAGELPEVPTLRKATTKMVATFKARGVGCKAKPWVNVFPSVAPESFEPVRITGVKSSKSRINVFLLDMSEEEFRVACDSGAFALHGARTRKRTTITIVRHFGLCSDCKRFYRRKCEDCKDPKCEDRTPGRYRS